MLKVPFYFSLLCLLLSAQLQGQDIITLTSGETILATNVAVDAEKIKYKKYADTTGRDFAIARYSVSMIQFEQGEVLVINPTQQQMLALRRDSLWLTPKFFGGYHYYVGTNEVSKVEFQNILRTDAKAFRLYEKGRNMEVAGMLFGIPGGLVFGYLLGANMIANEGINLPVFTASGIFFIGGIVVGQMGRNRRIRSATIYNSNNLQLGYAINGYGVGLALRF
jgi:hypothetical protein